MFVCLSLFLDGLAVVKKVAALPWKPKIYIVPNLPGNQRYVLFLVPLKMLETKPSSITSLDSA